MFYLFYSAFFCKLLTVYSVSFRAKDETGLTPLHIATQMGRLEIVKWLTALGISLNTETQTGYTAIHLAAMNGHLNCMIVSFFFIFFLVVVIVCFYISNFSV